VTLVTLERVLAWRDALRADAAGAPDVGLSRPGLRLVLDAALDALDARALATAVDLGGAPFEAATFVAARTVVTAPIEWLAVLLGRGTRVTLKHPAGAPGLAPWLAEHARRLGLPLVVTDRREAVQGVPLVIVMGDDATVAEVRDAVAPDVRCLGFGSRVSLAWWPLGDVAAEAAALARDLAAHDGRGCMTPSVILTDRPDEAADALAAAMSEAEARWPRGEVTPAEHAALRARTALARATGRVIEGPGWGVHVVPVGLIDPVGLPRAAQVVGLGADGAPPPSVLRWPLSVVGVPRGWVDAPDVQRRFGPLAARICTLGAMQRPDLLRVHERGLDHWRATGRGGPSAPAEAR
jgi:hypothetical protein